MNTPSNLKINRSNKEDLVYIGETSVMNFPKDNVNNFNNSNTSFDSSNLKNDKKSPRITYK